MDQVRMEENVNNEYTPQMLDMYRITKYGDVNPIYTYDPILVKSDKKLR